MDINSARAEIDGVDNEILKLFLRRMELCRAIAEEKGRDALPVRDLARETQILNEISSKSGEMAQYSKALFEELMAQSRAYQRSLLENENGYALIGEKLSHSFSPQIHSMLGISDYELLELSEAELEKTIRHSGYMGFNVTIPFKRKAMELCDELSEEAKAIGCVNTIVRKADEKLLGYNTDAYGLEKALKRAKIDVFDKKVLILGSGGASLTAQYMARKNGACDVTVVSRSGAVTYNDLPKLSDREIIFNATPVGMYPSCGETPLSLELFPDCKGVFDLVYNPLRTRLVMDAKRRGIPCAGGLAMLVYQAKGAQELFLNCEIADEKAEDVLAKLYSDMQSIVVIGMPGSGKTAVSKALAALCGKRLISIDAELSRETGFTPEQLIKTYGEAHFRALEHEQIKKAAAMTGVIIDTGGGAVERAENLTFLRQNGRIYCILRDFDTLATEGRPLSADLKTLFARREPMYRAFADSSIANSGSLEQTAQRIWEDFRENTCY